MIISTSNKFPPLPEQDSLFSFQISIPEDTAIIPSSYMPKKCSRCNSFLLQEENICPICNPLAFYKVKDTTYFKFFQIEEKNIYAKKSPVLFFLFDLDCDLCDLLSIANFIVTDATTDTQNSCFYSAINACFGFMGSSCQLYEKTDLGFHFYTLTSYTEILDKARHIVDFKNSLFSAINIAKKSYIPFKDKTKQMKQLCEILDIGGGNNSIITDVFYFLSGTIPRGLRTNSGIRFHIYNFAPQPSVHNMLCALELKSTYYFAKSCEMSLFADIRSQITRLGTNKCKLSVTTSSGAQFKDFFGPVSNTSTNRATTYLDLCFFSQSIPVVGVLKSQKDTYANADAFSVQILGSIIPGSIFVINEVWMKAKTQTEWQDSIYHQFFKGYYFQKHCSDALAKNFAKNLMPWSVPVKTTKFSKEMARYKDELIVYEEFIMSLCAQKSVIQDSFLMYLLLYVFYGQKNFLVDFIWALDSQKLSNHYIVLPPFIFLEGDFDQSNIVYERRSLKSLTRISISAEAFDSLKKRLQALQIKLGKNV